MANDKKFIVKNGLLTPQNAVIGSSTDTGEKLQVTGSSKLSGEVTISQSTAATPSIDVHNSGGYLAQAVIAKFRGDSDSLQIINTGIGDYKLVNSQQNNGIIFYDSTPGVRLIYNNAARLDINSAGNRFYGLSTTTIDGNRILTTADEGSGNGLDADTVDGLEASQFVRSDVDDIMAGNYTIQQDLTVSGNLTVSGTTTYVNTEEILLSDNIITLNANYSGSTPTENAGIEIERGTLDNPKLLWDEAQDYWKLISGNLTDLGRIITTADEGSGNGFDADTVDGLEASQFLRSDVDDTANGNITILGDLTIGDNVGGAQIIFDGANNNRTLFSQSGQIGFLNQAFNYSAKSDAQGNWIVEKDLVAGENVYAPNDVIAGDNVIANTGYVSAATNVTAGGDVIAEGNVVANTGSVTAATDVIGQRFVDADDNSYVVDPAGTSTMNNIGIDQDLFHNGDTDTKVTFTTDDISFQTGGAERLGIDNDSVDSTVTVTAPDVGVDSSIFHNGDADTKIDFTTDEIDINTGGATRLTANTTGIHVTNLTASDTIIGDDISAITEVESPIYYDKDDRTYYGDFASTSRVNDISLVGEVLHDGDADTYIHFSAADTFDVVTGGTTRLTVNNTTASASHSFTAPIFYDADDNTYYGDFATTSRINDISLVGQVIHDGDTNTFLDFNAEDSFQITTGGVARATFDNTALTVSHQVRAPIYYDSNDLTFYGDFATTSRINDISLVGEIIHDGDADTYIHFNAADSFQIFAGGNDILTANATVVTIDGNLNVTGDSSATNMYASIYYDADDNNYYADPAGDSQFNTLDIDDYVRHRGDINTYMGFSAADTAVIATGGTVRLTIDNTYITGAIDGIFPNLFADRYYDSTNATYYGDFAATSRVNDISLVGEIIHDGDADTYLQFHNNDQFRVVTGGVERFEVNNTFVLAANQMRSPIFYDSNNTAYYGNFAGTSVMNDINIDDYIRHNGDTDTYIGFDAADNFGVWTNNVNRLRITNSNSTFSHDLLAPRFVDSNNSSYYVDPANSTLSALFDGAVRIGSIANSSRWADNTGNGGIALLSHGDESASSNPSIAISGGNGGYSLMYLNRIDLGFNPYDNNNRIFHFYYDGTDGSKLSTDASGNLYWILKSGTGHGTWDSGGNAIIVANEDGNVIVGDSSALYAVTDNASIIDGPTPGTPRTTSNNKLHVNGSIQLNGNNDAIVFGRGTSTFLMDEELGFGWGGGWYMLDATYLRVRNNKTIYSTGDVWANRFYAHSNTNYYLDPDGDSQLNEVHIDDWIRHRGDTNTYIGFPSNDRINLATNGNVRLDITNSLVTANNPVKVNAGFTALELQKTTDGSGVSIKMSDLSNGTQSGSIEFWHADNAITSGANAAFLFRSTEPVTHFVFGSDSDGPGTTAANHAALLPQGNNTGYVGNANYRWQYIYGGTGNFSGDLTAANMYASRYYDADDNNYYADPNSVSVFRGLTLNNPDAETVLKFGPGVPANDDAHIEWRGGSNGGSLRISTSDDSDAGSTEPIIFGDYASQNRGGAFTEWVYMNRSYLQHNTQMRSPIYYDSNNTSWYTDPASTSRMNEILLDGNAVRLREPTGDYGSLAIDGGGRNAWEGFSIGDRMVFMHDNSNTVGVYNDVDNEWIWYAERNGPMRLMHNGTERARTENGYFLANQQIRSPIFYDSNDTNYYVDPRSTSRVNLIQALRYYFNHNTTYYMDQASGNYGSVKTGGATGGWSGYAIEDWFVFMSNGSNVGIYNDIDNEWMIEASRNAWVRLYYNNVLQAQTANGYFLANNQMRAPIYYDSNNTGYYANFAAGNTNNAIRVNGIYERIGFDTSSNGNNNVLLKAQDYSHWVWNTASNWGLFWAGNTNAAYSYFGTSNPNEFVFVGNGNVRASIDLDNGNAFFGGEVYADNFNIVGPGGNISLNPAYGSGGADLVLFDFTEYSIAEVNQPLRSNEANNIQQSEYVEVSNAPFAGKAIRTAAYRYFYSDYIPVAPGEDIYGEISTRRISGSGGLLYYGVERFDKDRNPIAGNEGTVYFVVGGSNRTSTSWETLRNHTTIPTSHTPYNGSDGGGCYYVRIRILLNYNSGGALREFGGIMLKRRNVESNLLVDDILADDITADDITADVIDANIFRDRGNTAYYIDPANSGQAGRLRGTLRLDGDNNDVWMDMRAQSSNYGRIRMGHYAGDPFIEFSDLTNGTNTGDQSWAIGADDRDVGSLVIRWNGSSEFPSDWTSAGSEFFQLKNSGFLSLSAGEPSYRLHLAGTGYATGDFRAPIFYDSNDTNYYVNPATGFRLKGSNGSAVIQGSWPQLRIAQDDGTPDASINYDAGSSYRKWNVGPGAGGSEGNEFGFAIYAGTRGTLYGTPLRINALTGYVQVGDRDNPAFNLDVVGTGYARGDFRAPIFYDSNDTNYYANPAGTSRFKDLIVTNTQSGPNLRVIRTGSAPGNNTTAYFENEYRNHSWGLVAEFRTGSGGGQDRPSISWSSVLTGTTWSAGMFNTNDWQVRQNHGYRHGSWGTTRFGVDGSGSVISYARHYAPIYYDYNDSAYYADPNSNSRFYDLQLRGHYVRTYAHSGSDFTSGTLVQTSIPATATNGASFVLEATGKSYSGDPPFSFTAQGYLYSNTIINYSGQHFGKPGFTTLYMFQYNGYLCFWWPRVSYWNSFAVHVRNANGDDRNLVTSITNSGLPGGRTKERAVTMKVTAVYNQNINTGDMYATRYYDSNDTSYYSDPHATSRLNETTHNRVNIVNGGPLYFYTSAGNLRGYIRAEDTNDSHLNIATSGNEDIIFRDGGFGGGWNQIIRGNGQVLIASRLDTPIMYDRNNTGYYADPNSTSNFLRLNVQSTLTSNGIYYTDAPSDYWTTSISGLTNAPISTRNRDYNVGGTSRFLPLTHQTALYSSGYRTHLNTGLFKLASGWGDGSTGWYAAIGGNDSYPTEAWYLTYGGYIQNSRGYVRTSGSFRAPIFYDQNNTGRYLDPNGTSRLQRVEFYGRTQFIGREADSAGSGSYGGGRIAEYMGNVAAEFHSGNDQPVTIYFRSNVNAPSDHAYITFDPDYNNSGENAALVLGVENDGNGSSDHIRLQSRVIVDSDLISSDSTTMMDWRYRNTIYGRINTDYMDHISDMRAPIFYDRNNTGYYVDPASTTQLHYVLANNWFRPQGATGLYFQSYGRGLWAADAGGNSYGNATTYGGGRNGWQGWGIGSRHVFMSTGGDNVGIHDNSRGWIMYWNGSYTRFQFGYTRMDGSARSPIFYDLNNTAYYFNGASDNSTRFRGVSNETMAFMALPGHTRDSGEYYRARPRITGDTNYWTGAMGWGRLDMNSQVPDWGSGFFDTWSNPGGQPAGTSHWVGAQAFHYSNGSARYGWQMAGGPIQGLWFRNTWSGWSSWKKIAMHGVNEYSGDLYATRYYDSNNTGYYADPNSTSNFYRLQLVNELHVSTGNGTGVGIRLADDGDIVDNNDGWATMRFSRGVIVTRGNRTNGARAYIGSDGNTQATSSLRAPIFYDRNNTGYYYDPHSTSNSAGRQRGGTLYGPNPSWGRYLAVGTNGHWTSSYASVATTNGNLHLDSQGGRDLYLQWYIGRTVYVENSLQARIMYDRNNTGYYIDPNSYSRLDRIAPNRIDVPYPGGNSGQNRYSLPYSYGFQQSGGWSYPYPDLVLQYHTGVSMAANPSYGGITFYNDYNSGTVRFQINGGSSYTYANTWINVGGGGVGIYEGYNGAHFYPNNATNYGSWNFLGSRNGWRGIAFSDAGYDPHLMWDSGGNGGWYHEDLGRWLFYHSRSRNCTGVASSSTVSGYRMRVNGSLYCNGNVVAYSDRRKKKNIQTIENALDKVLQLRGVTYERIEDVIDERDDIYGKTQMGLIAQEVMEVVPEVVSYAEEIDEYGLDYPKMVGLLVEAHKDQQEIINNQQKQIDELKDMVTKLMEKL